MFESDPDLFIFLEKGTRDGVSYISNRYSKASNKYLNLMMENKNQNIHTCMQIIYIVKQCLNFFQQNSIFNIQ